MSALPVFELGELLPIWGWWFQVDGGGERTLRLELYGGGKSSGKGKQRIPDLGERVELKGLEFVVYKITTEYVIVVQVPPSAKNGDSDTGFAVYDPDAGRTP